MRTPSEPFSDEETRALSRAYVSGTALDCPRCATALDERTVPPRRDVSYVRERLWVVCPSCHRTAVLDKRESR